MQAREFDVDNAEYHGDGCMLRIPLDNQCIFDALGSEGPGWASRTLQRCFKKRQGFGRRRSKCNGDDRCIIHDYARLAELTFEDAVPSSERCLGMERHASPERAHGLGDNGNVIVGGDADGSGFHGIDYISQRRTALLRVIASQRALVVSTGKNVAWVVLDAEVTPRIVQFRRTRGERSMPVPGDVVFVDVLEDDRAVLDRVEARTSTLERRSAAGRTKVIAANVDTLVTVTALANPPPRLVILDQLLAFAQIAGIDALAAFTKPDLVGADERRLPLLYGALGYPTLVLNPRAGEHVDALREALANRRALLCGISGVGKSTIFRALGGVAVSGEVSRFGIGRQTTTSARLVRRDDGFLIDSPGMNEFGLGELDAQTLTQGFREMIDPAAGCRFTDCRHLQEPDCRVKTAVAAGAIVASRYASYCKILLGEEG